ncbi:MAG: VWA domain-containing protein [Candidatus Omnitrophica bacterium]|nr:VWA domain-containing protein [Candidatus Omnitrophota bacterium]
MDRGKKTILALFISVTAHAVFFATSPHVIMSGMTGVMDETRQIFRLKGVEEEPAEVDLFEGAEPAPPSIKMTQEVSQMKSPALRRMMLERKLDDDLSLDKKKKEMTEQIKEDIVPEPEKFDNGARLDIDTKEERQQAAPRKRSLAERLSTESLVEYPARESPSVRDEGSYGVSRSPVELPSTGKEWEPSAGGVFQPDKADVTGPARVGEYEDIGRFLDVEVKVYEDPATGEKFFKIVIKTRKENNLGVIPKEVIFLVDSSKSITGEKLSYVKEGLLYSIRHLNQADRFNLVAFRGSLIRFMEESVSPRKRTLEKAEDFIGGLEAVGQTDVENALLGIINEPVRFRPSYIVLITDGRPTTGVTDSRRIIQQITRQNKMQRPIFCFGGGMRVNRYLLDFISYQNRAWSRFADRTHDMEDEFIELYRQIKDPILLNVRYRLKGVSVEEVYPKYLSDFYKGKPFTLYGRFEDEDVFSVQILGQMNGDTKEFIFKSSLLEAERGGADIAREWAFRKIYYLISRNTMGAGDPELLRRQINHLSRKYGIITPYDIEGSD